MEPSTVASLLERLVQGGVPLLSLAFATISLIGIVYMYRSLAKAQAEKVKMAGEWRTQVESLLREMIDRGKDAQEVISGNTIAVKEMTAKMQQADNRLERLEREVSSLRTRSS